INHGSNISVNVLYSGTMSAAVEGALENIPSIGFSVTRTSWDFDTTGVEKVVSRVINNSINNSFPDGTCLNVNMPPIGEKELKGIKICRQAKAYWEDEFESGTDPHGYSYYWLSGEFKNFDKGSDTDFWALQNNYASIVPVHYDMTAYHQIERLNSWDNNSL
ncbi:MAG: 5'/3'-nucleotidase SurE, partial [Flavobacteriales bacterium]